MSVCRSQMQRSIVSPIGSIDPGPSANEQFSKFSVTFLAAPMKRTEAMVIPNQKDMWAIHISSQPQIGGNLRDSGILYEPLIHVVLGIIEPDAHLHSVALAAPLKNVFHFSRSSCRLLVGRSSKNERRAFANPHYTGKKKSRPIHSRSALQQARSGG